jgi:hypothetical protein
MGKKSSQPTQAAAPQSQVFTPSFQTPPAGMGYDDTGTLQPLDQIKTFGGGIAALPRPPMPQVSPAPTPAPTPMAQPAGPSVFSQARGFQAQAGEAYGDLAGYKPTTVSAVNLGPAGQVEAVGRVGDEFVAGQLADVDYSTYMSPYTQEVIERGQADIERQRQAAMGNVAARAAAAGAFGGSRHGVQEGVAIGEYGRMAGDFAAQQRQAAFQQAQQAAQFDIGSQMQAQQLNQQAAEAAANREQAARMGNMQAANQFALQEAQLKQQANIANQQAATAAAGVRAGAASGLAGLGQQSFGQGMAVQQQIAQQAAQQRALQQQLLDAQRARFDQTTGAPLAGLGALSQILSGTPYGKTATTSQPFNPAALLALL